MCHRGSGKSGYFGAPGSDCDSPLSLVNATFDWIEENLKDKIDFVVWTGDAARHDKDDRFPRTEQEMIDMNELLVDKFVNVFSSSQSKPHEKLQIPIVPTIGNNDFMPHNIFKDGPNKWTKHFGSLWHKFVPEEQRHSFAQGGWFYVEVVPGKLAVISLNTMYFFKSNSAVDGCKAKSEPGYEHMEWLRTHLQMLRDKGMKAILIGHVPPARVKSKKSWYGSCWQKYTLWTKQYRDVIVGSMYGHMNLDHFMFQDFHDLKIGKKSKMSNHTDEDDPAPINISARKKYLRNLKDQWAKLPSPPSSDSNNLLDSDQTEWDLELEESRQKYMKEVGGPWSERYAMSIVSPSVIPNFLPSLRVIEYNISGLEDTMTWFNRAVNIQDTDTLEDTSDLLEDTETPLDVVPLKKSGSKKKKKHKKKKPKFKIPKPPSPTAPPGPAYSNQPFTWIGYTQYFANLTKINQRDSESEGHSSIWSSMWSRIWGNHEQDHEEPLEYEVEYDTAEPPYDLEDMTINSYLDLARRIASGKSSVNDVVDVPESYLEDDSEDHDESSSSPDIEYNDETHYDHSVEGRTQLVEDTGIDLWKIFLRRAFVGYVDDKDLDGFSQTA